ncbi:ABC transporter ATP-binding protein [Aliidongia dinghuensis]|uniref:ABC transporter ATP-binding protein n=1 Tax=Aliidongia dinghuensis TaxID=1867774 RepID=A0A8J2YUD1_9PROT|nr:ABC transporter ATP-binding protein [Aliidongia dinghuensis]GGF22128.1 ABC transporter ATP-binding protein [Aliidongia dinghuensis]
MTHLIEIHGLVKNFGPIEAVKGISFTVDRGEVLGFLGPNGAGKSTTMKMAAGFLAPSAGRAIICGHDVEKEPLAAKRKLGYLPEGAPAYPDMTTAGFLSFIAQVRGYRGAEARRRVAEAAERLELGGVMYQPIETLSKGFKRRVGLAQALLHDPEVLILDEPTDGLDPNQKHQVRELIHGMARDKAIIISTHILEEVDAVCTRAMVIAHGTVLADGTPGELEARSRYHNAVFVRGAAPFGDGIVGALAALPGVAAVEPGGRSDAAGLYVLAQNGADLLPAVREAMAEHGIPVAELRLERGRLDGVFRDITAAKN